MVESSFDILASETQKAGANFERRRAAQVLPLSDFGKVRYTSGRRGFQPEAATLREADLRQLVRGRCAGSLIQYPDAIFRSNQRQP